LQQHQYIQDICNNNNNNKNNNNNNLQVEVLNDFHMMAGSE